MIAKRISGGGWGGEGGGDGGDGGGDGGDGGGVGSTVNEVFTYTAIDELYHPYCQLVPVAMAVRSPLISAESVPLYAQLL